MNECIISLGIHNHRPEAQILTWEAPTCKSNAIMFSVNETPNAKVKKFCSQLMAEGNTLVWNILLEELLV